MRNVAWREYLGNPTLLFMEPCSKSDYFKAKIDKAGNHRLFKTVDRLFTSGRFCQLSIILWIPCLTIWMTLYVQRIRNLRSELEGISEDHVIPVANGSVRCFHLFSQFEIFSCDTVKQIIRSLSSKSCSLDPVPSHLLKNFSRRHRSSYNSYCQRIFKLSDRWIPFCA